MNKIERTIYIIIMSKDFLVSYFTNKIILDLLLFSIHTPTCLNWRIPMIPMWSTPLVMSISVVVRYLARVPNSTAQSLLALSVPYPNVSDISKNENLRTTENMIMFNYFA